MFMFIPDDGVIMAEGNSSMRETHNEVEEQRTIPVYMSTRNRIRELKGNKSYDEFLNELADKQGIPTDPSV